MKVFDFTPINKGGLAATFKLQLPIGMIIRLLLLRQKRNPNQFFATIASEKLPNGAYRPIVEFASKERDDAFQKAVMEAVKPYLAELLLAKRAEPVEQEEFFDDVPF
jgi:hypothetical protein